MKHVPASPLPLSQAALQRPWCKTRGNVSKQTALREHTTGLNRQVRKASAKLVMALVIHTTGCPHSFHCRQQLR